MKDVLTYRLRDGRELDCGRLELQDMETLSDYLNGLSAESRCRFGPHPFDISSLQNFYASPSLHIGFIAKEKYHKEIIGYSVIREGLLAHDLPRLSRYGIVPRQTGDFTYAPSVADLWQSSGLGSAMLKHCLHAVHRLPETRLLLWGGVQATNHLAIRFYTKNGFNFLGDFEYNGWNHDMVLTLNGNSVA